MSRNEREAGARPRRAAWMPLPGILLLALAGCGREGGGRTAGAAADTLPLAERRSVPGTLVWVSERDGNPEVYAARPSGEGLRRLTHGPEADYPAAVSPDGSGVLVVSVAEDSATQTEQMLLYPLDGGAPRPIGPRMGRSRSPSWSPDGRWIVFESDEASFRDLYRIGSDGASPLRLTDTEHGSFEPAVSPDGAWIAFASSRDGDAELYVMRADGSEQRRLTAFHRDDWGAAWSPDGRMLTFLSDREGADRVFLVRPDGTEVRRLTGGADGEGRAADVKEAEPAWSPDGGRLAFVRHTRGGTARILVSDLATGAVTELSDGRGRDGSPAWSPDGRYLAFTSDRDGDPELYLMRADGTGVTRLTHAPGADWLPRWAGRTAPGGAPSNAQLQTLLRPADPSRVPGPHATLAIAHTNVYTRPNEAAGVRVGRAEVRGEPRQTRDRLRGRGAGVRRAHDRLRIEPRRRGAPARGRRSGGARDRRGLHGARGAVQDHLGAEGEEK